MHLVLIQIMQTTMIIMLK